MHSVDGVATGQSYAITGQPDSPKAYAEAQRALARDPGTMRRLIPGEQRVQLLEKSSRRREP
jgi:hypothetical protein